MITYGDHDAGRAFDIFEPVAELQDPLTMCIKGVVHRPSFGGGTKAGHLAADHASDSHLARGMATSGPHGLGDRLFETMPEFG